MGAVGTITHSPFSSAVPVPTTCPLLVTVTSLPEAARPAITSAPAGSTRTTSNDGTAAADVGLAAVAAGLSVDGGTAACCVAVGAAAALDADGGAKLAAEDDPADCWPFPVALAAGALDSGTVVVAAVAVDAAALLEAEALEASEAAPADAVLVVALLVVGADVEAVPACSAPAWAAPALAVAPAFWPVSLVAAAVVCAELAD